MKTLDLDNDGQLEICAACAAVNNGYQGPDKLADSDSYILAIDANGQRRWHHRTGNAYTYPTIQTLDLNGDGELELLSGVGSLEYPIWQGSEHTSRPQHGTGEIRQIDKLGQPRNMYSIDSAPISYWTGDIDGDDSDELLISTTVGDIIVLGNGLEERQRVHIPCLTQSKGKESINVQFAAMEDFTGDGRMEILLKIYEPVVHYKNTSSDHRLPPTQRTIHKPRIELFNDQLQRIGRYVIAERWSQGIKIQTAIINHHDGEPPEIVVIADKLYRIMFDGLPDSHSLTPDDALQP